MKLIGSRYHRNNRKYFFHPKHSYPVKLIAREAVKGKNITGFKKDLDKFVEDRSINSW